MEELESRVAVLEQLALAGCEPIETKELPDDLKEFKPDEKLPLSEPEQPKPVEPTGETLV